MVTFRSFLEGGNDVLSGWYAEHPYEKRRWQALWPRYYNLWMHLSATPIGEWKQPYFKRLTGYDGMGRIEINYRNIAFRHVGYFGPGKDEYTILYCATEVDWVYLPKGCLDVAYGRMQQIKADHSLALLATIRTPPEDV